jgi:hypothetical protein
MILSPNSCKSEVNGQMILSKLDNLPCGYQVLGPNGDEINSFLEGGEVDLVSWSFQLFAKN